MRKKSVVDSTQIRGNKNIPYNSIRPTLKMPRPTPTVESPKFDTADQATWQIEK